MAVQPKARLGGFRFYHSPRARNRVSGLEGQCDLMCKKGSYIIIRRFLQGCHKHKMNKNKMCTIGVCFQILLFYCHGKMRDGIQGISIVQIAMWMVVFKLNCGFIECWIKYTI